MAAPIAPKDIWEFYDLLDAIEARLVEAGESSWAERIRTSVRGGSTSGEILTDIAVDLSDVLAAGVPSRIGIQSSVQVATAFIESAMSRKSWK